MPNHFKLAILGTRFQPATRLNTIWKHKFLLHRKHTVSPLNKTTSFMVFMTILTVDWQKLIHCVGKTQTLSAKDTATYSYRWSLNASWHLNKRIPSLRHASPTRGQRSCIMWPANTLVNYAYIIKITHQFTRLGVPLIVTLTRESRESTDNTRCGPLP